MVVYQSLLRLITVETRTPSSIVLGLATRLSLPVVSYHLKSGVWKLSKSLAKPRAFRRLHKLARWLLCGIGVGAVLGFTAPECQPAQLSAATISSTKERFVPVEGPFVLHRDGYSVCYDGRTKNPIWVYEHLTKDSISGPARRQNRFKEDPDLPKHLRSTLEDYKRSGYDRGHLAAAANHRYSQLVMNETFLLSNMSPQVGPGFNRGVLKYWAKRKLSGPERD